MSFRSNKQRQYQYRTFMNDVHKGEPIRDVYDIPSVLPYADDMPLDYYYTSHWGQKKLLYAEIEFLVWCKKKQALDNCILVYIGAAPGTHIEVLIGLFPELHFLLYDVKKIVIKPCDRVTVIDGDAGYFTDKHIPQVKEIANGKDIIYITDIRVEKELTSVWNDMINQQRWGILMGSKYMSLKFKLPYNEVENHEYNTEDIQDFIIVDKSGLSEGNFLYLDGTITNQINAPPNSIETRSYVEQQPNGLYKMGYWNPVLYEQLLRYFNVHIKPSTHIYKDSYLLKHNILGYDDSYDCCREYQIIDEYITITDKTSDTKETIIMIDSVNTFLMSNLGNDMIMAPLKASYLKVMSSIEDIEGVMNDHADCDYEAMIRMRIIMFKGYMEYTNRVKAYYNDQLHEVINGTILSKAQINAQLACFRRGKSKNKFLIYNNDSIHIRPYPIQEMTRIIDELQRIHNTCYDI